MKFILKKFLAYFLLLSSVSCFASSKRTFLMPRSFNTNLAMQYTIWHDHIFNYPYKDQSNLQFTPFFQASDQGDDIGKYFGVGNGKNSFIITTQNTVQAGNADITNRYLIHDNANAISNRKGTVYLTPKQQAGGLRLDFFQHLKFPFKGTFFQASMPIVYLENDINYEVKNVSNDANNTILDFFKGNQITQPATNAQNPLTSAKLHPARQSAFGVADIDLSYGYKFVAQDNKHLFLNIAVTIPTGNRVRGEYLFEPIYGNGHHVALGWGLDAGLRLWKKDRHCGKLLFAFTHRYLFEGTEKRTIPLNRVDFKYAHYYLTGRNGDSQGTALTPAANLLTQDLSVRPGNQFDAIALFNFYSSKFLIDIGYNFYAKESESISLKSTWNDDTYGVAALDYNVNYAGSRPFNPTNNAHAIFAINNSTLDIQGAGTPSQLTHKIFGALGYKFTIIDNPASIGIGGSYEFVNSNNALENYAFWAKLGLSF
ncbi:hypothetical protein GF322_00440 [Candidatus Dependentiae bacterium]|nr:hypothetical protein [Candidatus Dependentiae bacterium]